MWIFLGLCLLSRLGYSVNDVLVGRIAREHDGAEVSVWRGLSLGVLMAPLLLVVPAEAWGRLFEQGWEVLALACVTAGGNVLHLHATRYLPFGVRAAFVISGIAVVSGFLGWVYLGEEMASAEIMWSVVLVASAVTVSFGGHAGHEISPRIRHGAWMAVLAALLFAVAGMLLARLSRSSHPMLAAWAWEFGSGLVLVPTMFLKVRRRLTPGLGSRIARIARASSPTVIGSGAGALALMHGSLGVWAAVAGTQVLFTAALGVVWHGEKLGMRRCICFFTSAVAVAALGWAGSNP